MASPSVYIGLGSNVGDRRAHLAEGLEMLGRSGFVVDAVSSLYLTEPVDAPPQEWFVNAVAAGHTRLEPERLLQVCRDVEHAEGRERIVHHGPRTLDLDILIYGEELREGPELTLPHPHLHERRFVLTPLAELAPDLVHPRLGATVRALLDACPDDSRVVRVAESETLA